MSTPNNLTIFKGLKKPLLNNANGIALFYKATRKGEVSFSGYLLSGELFTPDDLFTSWRNTVSLLWYVRKDLSLWRADIKGIASNIRANHPYAITVYKDGTPVLEWCSTTSIMQKIGIVPTKKDLEISCRDFKKLVFKAAKISFEAMTYRPATLEAHKPETKPDTKVA